MQTPLGEFQDEGMHYSQTRVLEQNIKSSTVTASALNFRQTFYGLKECMGSDRSLDDIEHIEELELQLQKYEADIRQHLSIEQQLQIYIDMVRNRMDDQEKEIEQLKYEQSLTIEENRTLWSEKETQNNRIDNFQAKIRRMKEEVEAAKKETEKFKNENTALTKQIKQLKDQH